MSVSSLSSFLSFFKNPISPLFSLRVTSFRLVPTSLNRLSCDVSRQASSFSDRVRRPYRRGCCACPIVSTLSLHASAIERGSDDSLNGGAPFMLDSNGKSRGIVRVQFTSLVSRERGRSRVQPRAPFPWGSPARVEEQHGAIRLAVFVLTLYAGRGLASFLPTSRSEP